MGRVTTPGAAAKPRKRGMGIVPYAVVAVIVCGIAGLIGFTCHQQSLVREARDRFIEQLDGGDLAAARAELSTSRQRAMPQEAFDAYVAHPVLRRLDAGTYEPTEDRHPGICMLGTVPMDDGEWRVQLFFIEETRWRLHSIALQRPTKTRLGVLLPECGFGSGTMRGYNGPAPEHATPPT